MKLKTNNRIISLLNISIAVCLIIIAVIVLSYPLPLIAYNIKSIVSSKLVNHYFLNWFPYYCIGITACLPFSKKIFLILSFLFILFSTSYVSILFLNVTCEQCGNFGILHDLPLSQQLLIFSIMLILSTSSLILTLSSKDNSLSRLTNSL